MQNNDVTPVRKQWSYVSFALSHSHEPLNFIFECFWRVADVILIIERNIDFLKLGFIPFRLISAV